MTSYILYLGRFDDRFILNSYVTIWISRTTEYVDKLGSGSGNVIKYLKNLNANKLWNCPVKSWFFLLNKLIKLRSPQLTTIPHNRHDCLNMGENILVYFYPNG